MKYLIILLFPFFTYAQIKPNPINAPLLNYSVGANTAISASDTIKTAFEKLQGQTDNLKNPAITDVSSTGNQTTTSTAYVQLTGMSITPVSGTYQVMGTSTFTQNTNNAQVRMAVFSNGTIAPASELSCVPQPQAGLGTALNLRCPMTVISEVTVDGTQPITLRWNVSAGTGTSINRVMNIIRVR